MLLGDKDTFDLREVVGDYQVDLNERMEKLVLQHDKELRVMSWEDYSQNFPSLDWNGGCRSENGKQRNVIKCHIVQDGQSVEIFNGGCFRSLPL